MSMDPTPIPYISVRTERLTLRPIGGQDRTEFLRVHELSAEHFRRWIPSRPRGESLDDCFDRQLERAMRAAREGTGARYVALLDEKGYGEDGRIAGFFNLNNIVRNVFQNADAGWSVSADCAGRGLASEGVWVLLDIAFAPTAEGKGEGRGGLGLHRVTAGVIPSNIRSVRVAEKCGFRAEGLARAMLKINDQWQDHTMYAKLASEHKFRYLR